MIRHLSVLVISSFFLISIAAASDWRPVEPELLSQKAPVVEKDADVEGIFWDVKVKEWNRSQIVEENYIRLKVFTEQGKGKIGNVDIPYSEDTEIEGIEARTIKPDGSIVELKKNEIFERTLVSTKEFKVKAKSFAIPAIEPGVVVEYRWKEIKGIRYYSRYPLQLTFPVQTISYHLQLIHTYLSMKTATFNCPQIALVKESKEVYGFTLHNVPAFREEPQMPPDDTLRAFLLVFYSSDTTNDPEKYWDSFGKDRYQLDRKRLQPDDEVKKTAAQVTNGISEPNEKISKLFQFVRSRIININDDTSHLSEKQRKDALEQRDYSDILKKGMGFSADIRRLFGSLAIAAGFDARLVYTGDRADIFFNPSYADDYFLSRTVVAVRIGDEWKFFDPANAYLPMGMLYWGEEGNSVLLTDDKKPVFLKTPVSETGKSIQKRSAQLSLREDGSLEGDVVMEYSGHHGAEKKENNDDDSPTERETTLKKLIKDQFNSTEITTIQIENITDRDKPFIYRFHIRVVDYAQRTGKRLFFQPAFFQKGVKPIFPTSQRKYPVYFHFPWSEYDEVQITLPSGYELESPEGLHPITSGTVAGYELRLFISNDRKTLTCRRSFFFGGNDRILFEAKEYPALKSFFDAINEADNHTLTLKQTSTTQTEKQ